MFREISLHLKKFQTCDQIRFNGIKIDIKSHTSYTLSCVDYLRQTQIIQAIFFLFTMSGNNKKRKSNALAPEAKEIDLPRGGGDPSVNPLKFKKTKPESDDLFGVITTNLGFILFIFLNTFQIFLNVK